MTNNIEQAKKEVKLLNQNVGLSLILSSEIAYYYISMIIIIVDIDASDSLHSNVEGQFRAVETKS